MKHLIPFAMRLSLALLAAGCGAPDPESVGVTPSEIIGGAADSVDPAVMLLFAQKPNSNQGYLCSASLVSSTVLVTAAHCVSPQVVGSGCTFLVFSGGDWNKPAANSWLTVKEVHYDAAFDVNNLGAGHDVAVAILAQASAIKPLPMNRAAIDNSLVGKAVRLVGYGVNDGKTLAGVGVKRTVSTTLDDYANLLLHIGDSNHQSCEGDSGGPALMTLNGVETVVGVTSFGQVGCVGGGWDTRLDDYTSFLDLYAPPTKLVPPPTPVATPLPKALGRKK